MNNKYKALWSALCAVEGEQPALSQSQVDELTVLQLWFLEDGTRRKASTASLRRQLGPIGVAQRLGIDL